MSEPRSEARCTSKRSARSILLPQAGGGCEESRWAPGMALRTRPLLSPLGGPHSLYSQGVLSVRPPFPAKPARGVPREAAQGNALPQSPRPLSHGPGGVGQLQEGLRLSRWRWRSISANRRGTGRGRAGPAAIRLPAPFQSRAPLLVTQWPPRWGLTAGGRECPPGRCSPPGQRAAPACSGTSVPHTRALGPHPGQSQTGHPGFPASRGKAPLGADRTPPSPPPRTEGADGDEGQMNA